MVFEPLKEWLLQPVQFFSSIWHSYLPSNCVIFYICIINSNARCKICHSGRSLCPKSDWDSGSLCYLFHIFRVYYYLFPPGSSAWYKSGWESIDSLWEDQFGCYVLWVFIDHFSIYLVNVLKSKPYVLFTTSIPNMDAISSFYWSITLKIPRHT